MCSSFLHFLFIFFFFLFLFKYIWLLLLTFGRWLIWIQIYRIWVIWRFLSRSWLNRLRWEKWLRGGYELLIHFNELALRPVQEFLFFLNSFFFNTSLLCFYSFSFSSFFFLSFAFLLVLSSLSFSLLLALFFFPKVPFWISFLLCFLRSWVIIQVSLNHVLFVHFKLFHASSLPISIFLNLSFVIEPVCDHVSFLFLPFSLPKLNSTNTLFLSLALVVSTKLTNNSLCVLCQILSEEYLRHVELHVCLVVIPVIDELSNFVVDELDISEDELLPLLEGGILEFLGVDWLPGFLSLFNKMLLVQFLLVDPLGELDLGPLFDEILSLEVNLD